MTPLAAVAFWAAAFVGSHLLMSHPLRASLVSRLGERGFSALYSLVSFVTLGLMVWNARQVGPESALWTAPDGIWLAATLLMWFASILLVGSFRGNPALPNPGAPVTHIGEARGVFRITRHPMMWSFALWAVAHSAVWPEPSTLITCAAILLLALLGAAGQDRKKDRLIGAAWQDWRGRTSFVPFARGVALPDAFALIGGTLLFMLATWLHPLLGAPSVGPARWFS